MPVCLLVVVDKVALQVGAGVDLSDLEPGFLFGVDHDCGERGEQVTVHGRDQERG
jgi:hypothetical protein